MQPSWPQIIVSSLILPAAVALLVSRYEARRQDTRERDGWFDNIVSEANGVESAWYRSSELTTEKQQSTIDTVDEYVKRLKERKNSPLSPSEMTEAIERLDRRWIDTKDTLPVNQTNLYESHGSSIKRNARQIKYIVEQNRPTSLRERLAGYRPGLIQRLKRMYVLGIIRGRIRLFSYEGIAILRDFFSVEEINQIEKGEKAIRVTSPFDSRFCVNFSDDSDTPFLAIEGYARRLPNQPTLRNSFRVYPIEEDQLLEELGYAQEWELEDIETTREIAFEGLEL
ncbi:hypothetical protein [Natrinema altunense]|uniref:Uncharacterized protein n=1 Tax=Natrinema altunense TaxID=222984 RepID=A0A482XTW9_9EURY|nr:hypothetical protein [Natrinema altunense]RZH66468.1 hypothetical protein ELS17_17485 [Natrinema altunense]